MIGAMRGLVVFGVVAVVACNASSKTLPGDAAKPRDAPAVDVAVVATGPVTFALPKLAGDRAERPGMIAVALVPYGWRMIAPAILETSGDVTIPAGAPVSVEDIVRAAGAGGVLIVAPATARWSAIAPLAFALHRECWALAGARGVATWPTTCPPPARSAPDRARAELALWLDPGNVSIGAGPPPATFTTVPHAELAKALGERRAVFQALTYAIADTTEVATIVADVAAMRAAGFTAHWVPAVWLPLRFPNGFGTDPPLPPPVIRQLRVTVDTPVVTGPLTADEVARVVRARAGIYRACYQKELQRYPNIGGDLATSFTIDATGLVASAEARGSMKHEPVVTCVKLNLQRLRFAAKGAKTVVRVKITFAAD